MAKGIKIAIVGGGLAGLAAAMKIAEAGHEVDLFSVVPVKRSHSVCAQGGINGAVNTKGEGDSTWEHFDDTVYGGDFLANQPPAKAMCEMAPAIIYLFDRMGVPFSRTNEGLLDFRRFGGTKHHRTAFAGASTGQQLLYALDEQVRRFEVTGKVKKYEGWEMMSLVLDDHQVCRGIVAMNLRSLELKAFAADAVIIASGGPGLIFGKSTNSMVCTGSAVAACYQQGAKYANGEFIQVHPTSIPGEDKLRLMSESARGEGGRVWVPKNKGDKRTNISGLLAAGECDYSIHGANRLGANSLVSCVYGGFIAAPAAIEWAAGNVERNSAGGGRIYEQETKRQQEINDKLIAQSGA